MRVTILGSGTAVPVADRFPSGLLVRTEGTTLTVDLGPGTTRRLAQTGVGLEQLDAVLFTHFHTDHTGGIPELLFALLNPRYAGRGPLTLVGPVGLQRLLDALREAWRWVRAGDYELRVIEIEPGPLQLGELELRAHRVIHNPESLGYRLTDAGGRSLAVSGDVDRTDGLADLARDVDLFVCDAAYPEARRDRRHLTAADAGRAAAEAGAHAVCLTHFYPECAGADLAAEAAASFAGPVLLAEDLATYDLSDPAAVAAAAGGPLRGTVSPPTG